MLQKKIGLRIKELRLKNKMTQEKLSELANIDISFLSEIECGKRNISLNTIEKISQALKIDVNYLLNESIPQNHLDKNEMEKYIIESLSFFNYEMIYSLYTLISNLNKK